MLPLLEGIIINWYLSIVDVIYENIILQIVVPVWNSLPNDVVMANNSPDSPLPPTSFRR